MDLAAQVNEFNGSMFANPEVAGLVTVISNHEQFDISKIQNSMIQGVAWPLVNFFWSAQKTCDGRLLGNFDIFMCQYSLAA